MGAVGADSSVEGSVLSLPKGGGAISGLGETFAPDRFTGTGNYSVPLALPPGRPGLTPQLSLGYSTGTGNGPFGLGWQLSVPGVSCKTSRGVPRYVDAAGAGEDRVEPLDGQRRFAIRDRLHLERVEFAELGDLVERQRGIIQQPNGGRFRHQRCGCRHRKNLLQASPAVPGEAVDHPAMIGKWPEYRAWPGCPQWFRLTG